MVSEKKIFKDFPLQINVKLTHPGAGHFCPGAIILTILIKGHKVMLYAKYLTSRSCGFREEEF